MSWQRLFERGLAGHLSSSSLWRRSCSSLSLFSRASLLLSARSREASSGFVAPVGGLFRTWGGCGAEGGAGTSRGPEKRQIQSLKCAKRFEACTNWASRHLRVQLCSLRLTHCWACLSVAPSTFSLAEQPEPGQVLRTQEKGQKNKLMHPPRGRVGAPAAAGVLSGSWWILVVSFNIQE